MARDEFPEVDRGSGPADLQNYVSSNPELRQPDMVGQPAVCCPRPASKLWKARYRPHCVRPGLVKHLLARRRLRLASDGSDQRIASCMRIWTVAKSAATASILVVHLPSYVAGGLRANIRPERWYPRCDCRLHPLRKVLGVTGSPKE